MRRSPRANTGFSLLELLAAIAIVLLASAAALPRTLVGLDEFRAEATARYLAGRLQWARLYAAGRTAAVGLRFEQIGGRYCYGVFLDGNHDGVRTRDIDTGIDPALKPIECLPDVTSGGDLGLLDGVPTVGNGSVDENRNPVRIGQSSILTLSPTGSATPGTLYVRAGRRGQFAVRVLGATGRVRVLAFDWHARRWMAR